MSGVTRGRTVASVAALTFVVLASGAPLAFAGSGSPLKDPNIDGGITLCSRAGTPLTSGDLATAPFVWKAVASSAAPAQFQGRAGRATLAAYQPLKYVDPGDWSGSQLTGSSTFTNPDHPVVQSTNADVPLLNFVQSYPPHWQGLVEVRMLFTGANLPQHTASYPAAVLKVTGNRWTLVSGGGGSCSDGQGVSDESKLLPKHRLSHPQTVVVGDSHRAPRGQSGSGHPASSSTASNATTGTITPAAEATDSGGGVGAGEKAGIALAAVAVAGAAVGAGLWLRRRGQTS